MVDSIGIDIVEVERVRRAIQRWGARFLNRVFTAEEIEYCNRRRNSCSSFALRFAAKEAVSKAVGLNRRNGLLWTDIAILNDSSGEPRVILRGKTKERVGDKRVLISLSDTRELAVAQAVLVGE